MYRRILISLIMIASLVSCDKEESNPLEPDDNKCDDVCSGASVYTFIGYRWSGQNPNPVFRFSTSLPEAWRSSATSAAAKWNQVNSRLQIYVNYSPVHAGNGYDGLNVVSYGTLSNAGALGECHYWYDPASGAMLEADIILNINQPLTVGAVEGKYDVTSILAHEFGHFCGLDHVTNQTHTMFWATAAGCTRGRTLCTGDEAGVKALYGSR